MITQIEKKEKKGNKKTVFRFYPYISDLFQFIGGGNGQRSTAIRSQESSTSYAVNLRDMLF
jgi:hypothetical protein